MTHSSVAASRYARLDEGIHFDTDIKFKEVIQMHHIQWQFVDWLIERPEVLDVDHC